MVKSIKSVFHSESKNAYFLKKNQSSDINFIIIIIKTSQQNLRR
jgi:hypothetical protein